MDECENKSSKEDEFEMFILEEEEEAIECVALLSTSNGIRL